MVETIPADVAVGAGPAPGDGEVSSDSRAHEHHRELQPPSPSADPWTTSLAIFVIAVAGLVGLALRAWLIFHTPSNSDEAIVGLIAQGALHGHFTAFYWGQQYGGTIEPDVIAIFFLVFGQNGWVEGLAVGSLSVVAAILTWRVTLRLVKVQIVALLAGALTWAAPEVVLGDSVRTYGFRGVALACGLAMLLLALRVLDGHRGLIDFAGLGLAAGIGWWSSPEAAYYAVPTIIMLVSAVVRTPRPRWRAWLPATAVMVSTLLVSASPWIWANIRSGFASLNTRAWPGSVARPGLAGRLWIFFHKQLPMSVGLLRQPKGAWLVSVGGPWLPGAVAVLVFAVIVAAVLLCLARGGSARYLGIGIVLFPFLFILSPASWNWVDARYDSYLPPMLAMALAVGCCEGARRLRSFRRPRHHHPDRPDPLVGPPPPSSASGLDSDRAGARRNDRVAILAMSAVVILSITVSVIAFSQFTNHYSRALTRSWGNPDAPTMEAIAKLEAGGVTTGYADYWAAYKLDFLSRGRLTITTAGYDTDRSRAINARVVASPRPAWLFVPVNQAQIDGTQFSAPSLTVGPDSLTEFKFLLILNALGIHYRIIDAGILQAVEPSTNVTQAQAQLPGVPGA